MNTTNTVIIGGTILVVVLLVLWFVTKWGVFEDDNENTNTGTERVRRELANEAEFDLSWRKKTRAYSLPVKLIGGSFALLSLGFTGYAYLILRGGAPVELPYANAMKIGVVVCVSLYAGVKVSNTRSRGSTEIIYENDDGSEETTETIHFDPAQSTVNSDGNPVVYEQFERLNFGLWGKNLLVQHDRDLRTKSKPLHDRVSHEIPSHAVKVGPNKWVMRTQGQKVNEGPDVAADYSYRPPDVLPHTVRVQRREKYQKMKTEYESLKVLIAQKDGKIRNLRRELMEDDRRDLDWLVSKLEKITNSVGPQKAEYRIQQDRSPERQPQSQREVGNMNRDTEEARH